MFEVKSLAGNLRGPELSMGSSCPLAAGGFVWCWVNPSAEVWGQSCAGTST